MPNTQCPICSTNLSRPPAVSQHYDACIYNCSRCGQFIFSDYTEQVQGFEDSRKLISAWIRHQNKLGNSHPFVAEGITDSSWFESLRLMGFPKTVNEKLDALLKAYADIARDDYGKVIEINRYPELVSEIAANGIEEVNNLNQLLAELNYVWPESSRDNDVQVKLSAKGWLRIDELSKSIPTSDSAFIAMWYDDCLQNYLSSVTQAVRYCGYRPLVIKDIEFNNFIMDEVISLIRQSRFLIADLTCRPEIDEQANPKVMKGVRGGVYWESGIAYGMDKIVIQTCEASEESTRRIHFDLDQYQTVFWKQDELSTEEIRDLSIPIQNPSFAEKLAQRIITTVGRGNYTEP